MTESYRELVLSEGLGRLVWGCLTPTPTLARTLTLTPTLTPTSP